MVKRADLHMHSHVSDGEASPGDVVRLAHAAGLDIIALTDHDTAAGVNDAVAASADLDIEVVPGIEISTRLGERELHILGYWIDPEAPSIVAHQAHAVERRRKRMEKMVAGLQELGIEVSMDDVLEAAGEDTKVLGRPHLARAMLNGGHTRYFAEAFDKYIADDGPVYVAEGMPEPTAAFEVIRAAGGVPVWAHPPLGWFEEGVEILADQGLAGVECYRPGTDPDDITRLERAAHHHNLIATGGSDWHGPKRSVLGDFSVAADRLVDILAFGGITV